MFDRNRILNRQTWKRIGDWARRAEPWQIVAIALIAVLILPAFPVLLLVGAVATVYLFGKAWVREFTFLMSQPDEAFPGRSDELIWTVLLIALPPVGAYLLHSYRTAASDESEAERKPASPFRDFF